MGYNFRNLSKTQKEDLKLDIETLVQEKKSFDKVTMKDIDTLCKANDLDLDYADVVIKMVVKAFKGDLHEDHIISKTGADGETSFEAVPEDVARQLNGTTTTDTKGNKTTVKDTGKQTLGEEIKRELNQQDILNLAKDLDVCTKEALRATGNEVAYTQQFFNKKANIIRIEAHFQQDADNPGRPSGQGFPYKIVEGKIVLITNDGQTVTNISAIQLQSGTANINRDLAIDSIKQVLSKEDSIATGEAGSSEPAQDDENKAMLEEFSKAVAAYKAGKSKESIKELLRSARNFPGDDIQHKFANAIQMYKGQQPECNGSEQCSDCALQMSESLFIRLLEFAKEDVKDDVDLHEVAENVARICSEGKCASIDDYDTIISGFEHDHPEAGKPGEEMEQPEQLQEETNNPTGALISKINAKPETSYAVYLETREDKESIRRGKPSAWKMPKEKIIDFLQKNQDRIESCYMPGTGVVQIQFKVGETLQENEPDEVERWDDDEPAYPGDEVFFYDPETKDIWDEGKFDPKPGKRYVTGTISCAGTGIDDQSFDHEFGTEYVYVPICTEVDIEIDGISDEEDLYDTEEDKAEARKLLTKEDWDIIREWGLETLSSKMI